ncbi:hypothetical protein J6590_075171 [Homalodisca vitripennis]|nr:hypothetical protein J6590_075171 [Homalodisca vitripennis]
MEPLDNYEQTSHDRRVQFRLNSHSYTTRAHVGLQLLFGRPPTFSSSHLPSSALYRHSTFCNFQNRSFLDLSFARSATEVSTDEPGDLISATRKLLPSLDTIAAVFLREIICRHVRGAEA